MGTRILTVVDAYSAIVDRRVYKEARSHEDAVEELKKHKGTQFDPDIVEIFLKLLEGGETKLLSDQQSNWHGGDEHLQAMEKTLFRGL